jgi:hypothetical protein
MIEDDNTLHILSYPYEDRKLICFYDTTEIERQIFQEQHNGYLITMIGTITAGLASLVIFHFGCDLIAAVLVATLAEGAGLAIKRALSEKVIFDKKHRLLGDAANPKYIWKLGQGVLSEIVFPAGHPKNKVVYVGRQFLPNTYCGMCCCVQDNRRSSAD